MKELIGFLTITSSIICAAHIQDYNFWVWCIGYITGIVVTFIFFGKLFKEDNNE